MIKRSGTRRNACYWWVNPEGENVALFAEGRSRLGWEYIGGADTRSFL